MMKVTEFWWLVPLWFSCGEHGYNQFSYHNKLLKIITYNSVMCLNGVNVELIIRQNSVHLSVISGI